MRRIFAATRWIHIAPLFALITLSAWVFASPMGASADDDFHLTSVWCASGNPAANCTPGSDVSNRNVPRALLESACYLPNPGVSAECQTSKVDFNPHDTVLTQRGNFVGGYPPLFYDVMGLFVGPNILFSILAMRIASVLLFVVLTSALYALLSRERRPTLIWSWLVTTVPLGLFFLASNNPSSWTITGVGTAWLALIGWYETRGRRRVGLGILFAIAVAVAAGSRGDGAIYAAMGIVFAAFLSYRKTRRFLIASILPLAALAVCVYFFISAQQVISGLNGFGGPSSPEMTSLRPTGPLLVTNLLAVPYLWAGIFGTFGLGWLEVLMPPLVAFAGVACFVALAMLGFARLSARKAIVLALCGLAVVIVPVFVLTRGGDIVGEQVQPRYLLPLIVMFAGLLMFEVGRRQIEITRGQVILVTLTLSIIQAVALHATLRRYVSGTGVGGFNLDSSTGWWWTIPLSPLTVFFIGSVMYAATIWVVASEVSLNGYRRTRTAASAFTSVKD